MPIIGHDHTIRVFYQLYAMDVAHSPWEGLTFWNASKGEAHSHHAARIDVRAASKKLGQGKAVMFIDIAQRDIRIHVPIHRRIDFLVLIVMKVQKMYLSGLNNVVKHWWVDLRGFLRSDIHHIEGGSQEKRMWKK